jgi:hypothetical protein
MSERGVGDTLFGGVTITDWSYAISDEGWTTTAPAQLAA